MARRGNEEASLPHRRRRATTAERRENQLIALAMNEAERQMEAGTASATVITHYLKLATTREQREMEKLENENALLRAKKEQIDSAARVEELYGRAITAMRAYSGQEPEYYDED